jgi:hypothetical protein
MYTMHYDHSHKTTVPTELLQDPYLSVDTKGLAAILCSFGSEAFELSELADQLRDNLSDERTFRALMELYAIPTPRERLNAACSPRFFKSCWVTQV